MLTFIYIHFRAKARPSKKAKLNKPADDDMIAGPEKTLEPSEPNIDDILDDPPAQDHDTFVEQVEIDSVTHDDKPPTPTKATNDKTDDVVVTSISYTALGNPTALSKHRAKEEFSTIDKGKWKVDLESYAHLSAQDIHSGFLNRLYTSRDYEAKLLNMMKERYKVNAADFCIVTLLL